ncbi:MAG TPA: nuclear transport factor 2 family protein, partial [Gammaproteobacteria bacterium]|nr:nuclear transport factor 2 family protein [Gammaproteobacteria bacterium]
QLAGSHRGKQAILGFLARVQALSAGSFGLELIDVLANDERAVALFRGHAKRNGLTLDNPTCLHMRIANGRIAELWEFVWDLYDVDAFWT